MLVLNFPRSLKLLHSLTFSLIPIPLSSTHTGGRTGGRTRTDATMAIWPEQLELGSQHILRTQLSSQAQGQS